MWMETLLIDQIKQDVLTLATSEGREVGTRGHDVARGFIVQRLTELGVCAYSGDSLELGYKRDGVEFTNIVGRVVGKDRELEPVLLGAHYDTCGPLPGAGDNAAAVAALLSVASHLVERPPECGVILAFFDAEEPPFFLEPTMGSIRFYEDQRRERIHCAVVMDLVGHDVPIPGLEDLLFIIGMESDPGLAAVVRETEPSSDIRIVPTLNRYVGDLSDHHIFRVNQRPYLLLTRGRWEDYHEPSDTPDKLNYEKIEAIARYLCALAAGVSFASLQGPFEGYDPTDTEVYFLEKTAQPFVDNMGLNLQLRTRQDVDRLVEFMLTNFDL